MATYLKKLVIDRVDGVDAGANVGAHVLLWKRDLVTEKRTFTAEQRRQMAGRGSAMREGGFPIANAEDLRNAIRAIGRAKNPGAAKAHIKRRAAALGLSSLIPDTWKRFEVHKSDEARLVSTFAQTFNKLSKSLDDSESEAVKRIVRR